MAEKVLYKVTAEVCLCGASCGELTTRYTHAYSERQAVKQVALLLKEELGTTPYLKDYEVEKVKKKQPSRYTQKCEILIKTPSDILTQYELDVAFEKNNGCSDLELLRGIIVTGVNMGFLAAIRELAENSDWERVAEIIQRDPNFTLEPKLPSSLPLFSHT